MIEKQKTEVIVAQYERARGGISSSSEKKRNYKNDTKDEIDPD